MIPQPFPPFPFPPFPPSPFSPFLLFSFSSFAFSSARRSHLRWLRCGFILCINPSFRTFRTPVPIVVYQPCPPSLSVPQVPLPCTNRVPYLVLCRESTFLNRTLLTIFRRMTVICFCLHLMEIMSPLRTVPNQACDGSARWMNGSRSGVFGPDPTSEPCLNLSRHLARSRTL